MRVTSPKDRVQQQMLQARCPPSHHGRFRPGRPVSDAPEALWARRHLRLEHRRRTVAETQVGAADGFHALHG